VFNSLIQAKSCPCELVANETPTATDTSAKRSVVDDESQDESMDNDKFQELTNLYPFVRQIKRLKRPSWATIGKRSAILIKKRPSWAQIG